MFIVTLIYRRLCFISQALEPGETDISKLSMVQIHHFAIQPLADLFLVGIVGASLGWSRPNVLSVLLNDFHYSGQDSRGVCLHRAVGLQSSMVVIDGEYSRIT